MQFLSEDFISQGRKAIQSYVVLCENISCVSINKSHKRSFPDTVCCF